MAYYTLYFLTFAVVICGTGMSDPQTVYLSRTDLTPVGSALSHPVPVVALNPSPGSSLCSPSLQLCGGPGGGPLLITVRYIVQHRRWRHKSRLRQQSKTRGAEDHEDAEC